jgi:hypothetical protein
MLRPQAAAQGICGAIIVAMIAGCSTGCGALIRQEVNKKFPPITEEQRQLGAIQTAIQGAESNQHPNTLASLPAADLTNYLRAVLSEPLPYDAKTSAYFEGTPTFTGTTITLGKQELQLVTDFAFTLKGSWDSIDLNHIAVGGHLSLRLMPEVVTDQQSHDVFVRLRPAVTNIELCQLDFSKTSHATLYWFERRHLLSTAFNTLTIAFRDNVNGALSAAAVPIAMPAISVGRDPTEPPTNGVIITAPVISVVKPYLANGFVLVAPDSLKVLGTIATRVYDPANVPPEPVRQQAPPEPIPDSASSSEIDLAYTRLAADTEQQIANAFGSDVGLTQPTILAQKAFIAAAINGAFQNRTANVTYQGPLAEHTPENDDQRTIRLPSKPPSLYCEKTPLLRCDIKGVCQPYLVQLAVSKREEAKATCADIASKLQGVASTINSACQAVCFAGICLGDVVAPGECAQARSSHAALEAAQNLCQATIDAVTGFLDLGSVTSSQIAHQLGVGDFYDKVCTYYDTVFNKPECEALETTWKTGCGVVQGVLDTLIVGQKVGEDDWMYRGVGPSAVTGTVTLQSVVVDPTMTKVSVGATANGSVTVEGRFQLTKVEPLFLPICQPSLSPVVLRPTSINFSMDNHVVTGAFGITPFTDPDSGKQRNAFAFNVDPISVTVSVDRWPIHVLLRDNFVNLPCVYNGVVWWTYAVADLLMVAGNPLTMTNVVAPPPARVGWADSHEHIPYAWAVVGGATTVSKTFAVDAHFATSATALSATLDNIPPQSTTVSPRRHETAWALNGGLGESITIGQPVQGLGYGDQVGRFASAINPFIALGFGKSEFGPIVGISAGPRLATLGLLVGASAQPFSGVRRLTVFGGVRLSTGTERPGQGVRLAFGAGWVFGHLRLRGCEYE